MLPKAEAIACERERKTFLGAQPILQAASFILKLYSILTLFSSTQYA